MNELNCNKPFKEAVCIDVMRVFDSCSSQECLEDLEFSFDDEAQEQINEASYIKSRCIEVTDVTFAIDPVPFNSGFYTVDVTYTFTAEIEVYTANMTTPTIVSGEATFSKKVILFGSDGKTQRFASDGTSVSSSPTAASGCAGCCDNASLPIATVSIVSPMCLDAKLVAGSGDEDNTVLITIGIFAIIQLERPVSLMVPAYDYCVPDKECSTDSDTPCELFDKIAFPTAEFFPRGIDDSERRCCGRSENGGEDEDEE